MTDITQPTIDRALTHVQRECEILETERDAFRTLLGRVSGFQIDPPGSVSSRWWEPPGPKS
ncbi:hypothetical protein [Halorhabdus rudnickae]|uniref:hypothetical protein n=1 Tax=Halorhabdus rudnickae TaxID=1775544 RepID=UPI0010846FDC|nr:hypothetical protein [Halorhabdus rudnickae]